MMPYTSDVDNALVAKLGADAELLALCPNGVYWDAAPPGMTRFVIVSLVAYRDEPMFGGTAYEEITYAVDAFILSTTNGDVYAAGARIDALLHDGTLNPPGYRLMAMQRTRYMRDTPRDAVDQAMRWFQRGGEYQVMVSPEGATLGNTKGV